MKNRRYKFIISLILIFLCISCTKKANQKVEREEFAFGTIIKMIVYTKDIKRAENAIELAFEEMERIDKKFNTKYDESIFSKLNKNPQIPVVLDEEGISLIKEVLKLSKETNGKYDITIAPLLSLWGFSNTNELKLPQKNNIEEILKFVNYRDIIVKENKIHLRYKEQQIDTGSFLKGYALSRAKEILKKEGIESAYISAISSIETIGEKPTGKWRIGLQNPENASEILKIVTLKDKAMGVSGDYQTFVEIDGQKYHHIMDVTTGYPTEEIKMLAIISENSFLSDLYSTAYFSYKAEEIIEIINKIENMEALAVDKTGKIFMTKNMTDYLDKGN